MKRKYNKMIKGMNKINIKPQQNTKNPEQNDKEIEQKWQIICAIMGKKLENGQKWW